MDAVPAPRAAGDRAAASAVRTASGMPTAPAMPTASASVAIDGALSPATAPEAAAAAPEAAAVAAAHRPTRADSQADPDAGKRRMGWASYAVISGLALGFAAGTKPGFVVGALIAVVLVLLAASWRSLGWRRPAGVAVILAALLGIVGAPFYVRNWIELGNPLAPFALKLGPIQLPGMLDLTKVTIVPASPPELVGENRLLIMLKLWFGYQNTAPYWKVQYGFGWQWPLLALPALVGWIIVLFVRRRAWYFALLLVPIAGVVLTHPVPWLFRYVLFLVAPGVVALCLGLQWLCRRRLPLRLIGVALCLVAACCTVVPLDGLRINRVGITGATTVRHLTPSELVSGVRAGQRLQIYDQPGVSWAQSLPDGSVIGVAGRGAYFPAPLYGRRAQNRIVLLAQSPDEASAQLVRDRVDYVYLIDGDRISRWAARNPGRFQLIYETGPVHAYKVICPPTGCSGRLPSK